MRFGFELCLSLSLATIMNTEKTSWEEAVTLNMTMTTFTRNISKQQKRILE